MELKLIIEALLLNAQKPQSVPELRSLLSRTADAEEADEVARSFRSVPAASIESVLRELAEDHEKAGRSYRLVCVAGAWQFVTQPDFAPWIRLLVGVKNRPTR